MVTAAIVVKELGIPRGVLYRLVERKKIPFHPAPRERWHERRRLLFNLDEVRAALAEMQGPPTD